MYMLYNHCHWATAHLQLNILLLLLLLLLLLFCTLCCWHHAHDGLMEVTLEIPPRGIISYFYGIGGSTEKML